MRSHVLFGIIINIGVTLFISIMFIRRDYRVRALKIFLFLYIMGQVLGYGFGVDILKSVIPSLSDPENGITYQVITSTILPLLLAFTIDDILKSKERLSYEFFIRMMFLTLILIGLLQFIALPKVLDYILLALAIGLGGLGLYKKINWSI